MSREKKPSFTLNTVDDMFTTQEIRDERKLPRIRDIPIKAIKDFPDHPYKVKDDEDMMNLMESIKENGVLTPVTVRKIPGGSYEMISGHRRKRACELLGMPVIRGEVVELDRDEAIIMMCDSNLQRTTILPSEKAFAYKMRMEAMKRLPGRPVNGAPVGHNFGEKTRDLLASETGDSKSQIQRYIRLTELIPEILELVDEGKIALRPAVEISYLPRNMQESLVAAIHYEDSTPSHAQARELRALSDKGILTQDLIYHMMGEEKPNQKDRFILKADRVKELFPKNLPISQREDYVVKAMEHYAKYRARREREKER